MGLPHARGGVSKELQAEYARNLSSPRPWGCFHVYCRIIIYNQVFPTPVGVFLTGLSIMLQKKCLPHARGGVSKGA